MRTRRTGQGGGCFPGPCKPPGTCRAGEAPGCRYGGRHEERAALYFPRSRPARPAAGYAPGRCPCPIRPPAAAMPARTCALSGDAPLWRTVRERTRAPRGCRACRTTGSFGKLPHPGRPGRAAGVPACLGRGRIRYPCRPVPIAGKAPHAVTVRAPPFLPGRRAGNPKKVFSGFRKNGPQSPMPGAVPGLTACGSRRHTGCRDCARRKPCCRGGRKQVRPPAGGSVFLLPPDQNRAKRGESMKDLKDLQVCCDGGVRMAHKMIVLDDDGVVTFSCDLVITVDGERTVPVQLLFHRQFRDGSARLLISGPPGR